MSVLSFLAFVVFAWLGLRKQMPPPAAPLAVPPATLPDVIRLIEAVAKLSEALAKFTDSLAKAGPAIAALVASMVFLLAALVAAR